MRLLALLVVGSCTYAPIATKNSETRSSTDARESSRSVFGPVTIQNFGTHPSVKEIDLIVREVEELEEAGKLEVAERTGHESCENYEGDMLRTISRDAKGRAVKLTIDAGSGDSTATVDAYYDLETKLRFMFVKASAANDTVYEYRIYFGRDGEKLWERRTLVRGPGYTFPTPWLEGFTPRDPEARFAGSTTCD